MIEDATPATDAEVYLMEIANDTVGEHVTKNGIDSLISRIRADVRRIKDLGAGVPTYLIERRAREMGWAPPHEQKASQRDCFRGANPLHPDSQAAIQGTLTDHESQLVNQSSRIKALENRLQSSLREAGMTVETPWGRIFIQGEGVCLKALKTYLFGPLTTYVCGLIETGHPVGHHGKQPPPTVPVRALQKILVTMRGLDTIQASSDNPVAVRAIERLHQLTNYIVKAVNEAEREAAR